VFLGLRVQLRRVEVRGLRFEVLMLNVEGRRLGVERRLRV